MARLFCENCQKQSNFLPIYMTAAAKNWAISAA
jgi:hypothetical protein